MGEKNKGWYHLVGPYLAAERACNAATQLGEMECLFEELLNYAKGTRQDGVSLAESTTFRNMLAEMRTELLCSRLLIYRCFSLIESDIDAGTESCMAKLYTSEMTDRITNMAMEMMGQSGEIEESIPHKKFLPLNGIVPKLYCDNQRLQIAAGSSEIMRNVIAMRGLGLPRG